MSRTYVQTSESVSEGHPDKIADQISDAVLDAMIGQDPMSRVACETFVTTGLVLIGGEIATDTYVDLQKLIRKTVKDIGYDYQGLGFYHKDLAVMNMIHEQSVDIAQGVVRGSAEKQGAGDQGLMWGYAINHTEQLMPLPIELSHDLTRELSALRKKNKLDYLRPDGKSQVAIRYEGGKPKEATKVVIATQHAEEVEQEKIKEDLLEYLIKPVMGEYLTENTEIIVNGTGKFVIGGPHGDAGLTGRKIIVDTYGGLGYHGGGAFSGKDPSKVDRTGSYAARYIAKNIVHHGLADEVNVQIAYSIGIAEPFSFDVDTKGTGKISDPEIIAKVRKNIDLRPGMLIDRFDLRRPIYLQVAAYGHFGRKDLDLPWEQLDLF